MGQEYILQNYPIRIGTKNTSLQSIAFHLEEYDFNKFRWKPGTGFITKFKNLNLNLMRCTSILKINTLTETLHF